MFEGKVFLEKIHIKNFLSLRNVTLPFKPLTVLVGPNASGKSNTCEALRFLKRMMVDIRWYFEALSDDFSFAGKGQEITFQLQTKVAENQTLYNLVVKTTPYWSCLEENLSVNDVDVISIQDREGVVSDENGEGRTLYNANELALGSAGNYGNKPITRAVADFIKEWKLYRFSTDAIRIILSDISLPEKEMRESPRLGTEGAELPEVLWNWYNNSPESFRNVSDSLASSTNLEIDCRPIKGQKQLCLLEGNKKPIQLRRASDGILRLIAYYILLNEPELPPLIAIEEPEQNLHPGALTHIADALEQIAERSQVIITTHSSQLLGAFNRENLGDSLGVLLLRNRPDFGTEVLNIEDYRGKKKAFDGWIADFGIGSAVFDLGIPPDEMEDTTECQA